MTSKPAQVQSRFRRIGLPILLILGIIALLISIIIPTLNRYRETAGRDPCASNLRQLGQALLLYQQDHQGLWPARLEDAASALEMSPVVLKCIVSEKPFVFLRPGARGEWFGENDLIAYEPPDYHDGRGGNALFGDGHITWLTPDELKAAIARPAPTTRPAATSQSNQMDDKKGT